MILSSLTICVFVNVASAVPASKPCPENAERVRCGSMCPTTCEDIANPEPKICPAMCKIDACECKKGYVLNNQGECVLPQECPNGPCPKENQERVPCGNPYCAKTCEDVLNPQPKACPEICEINACECKKGYVLNGQKDCIPEKDCIKESPVTQPKPGREPCDEFGRMKCDEDCKGHQGCAKCEASSDLECDVIDSNGFCWGCMYAYTTCGDQTTSKTPTMCS